MKIYLVGGAVRDKLLGLPIKERDYVVVGGTEADMLSLGYQRVGKEFPVFLHPKTREEYALARAERKTGPGYKGFTVDASTAVTLEEDLKRRDLTINAMAEDEDGNIIDPYGGQTDLAHNKLRHVSEAFAEDPVRILRIGRFLSRYAYLGFTVDQDTTDLMKKMVAAGEVDALVAERVWKELDRALGEPNPEKFFELLDSCGALAILFPGIEVHGTGMTALRAASALNANRAVCFAALLHDATDTTLGKRYRAPNDYQTLARLVAKHYLTAFKAASLSDEETINLLSKLDVYRRGDRFEDFLLACQAIAEADAMQDFSADWLRAAAQATKEFPVQKILEEGLQGEEFAKRLKLERTKCIAALRKQGE